MDDERYLGDGVYAGRIGDTIKLWTRRGYDRDPLDDVLFFEPREVEALLHFLCDVYGLQMPQAKPKLSGEREP